MKSREFDVVIGPDGTVELQVRGYKGPACLEIAKWFETTLGHLQSQQLTSEYYDPQENVQYHVDQRH